MTRHRPFPVVAVLLATAAIVVAACGSSNGPLGSVPPASNGPEPSVDLGSPDIPPGPSDEPSDEPSDAPSGSAGPGSSPAPSSSPTGTTILRAYFWLGGLPGSDGLVAVLR